MANKKETAVKKDKKETEQDKAHGVTESQKALRAYNAGDFQTHDPVTGKKRGPLAYHARPEAQTGPVGEEAPPRPRPRG